MKELSVKNIRRYLEKYPFIPIFIFLLIFGSPTIFTNWALVDDGKSAEVSFKLTQSLIKLNLPDFFHNLIEPVSGRFRPGYWLYLWATFLIGSNSPVTHHLIQFLLFLISAVFIYKIGILINKKTVTVGILAAVFFIIEPQTLENWYRLGPQEPLIIPLLLISFFLFWKGRSGNKKMVIFAALFSFLAYTIKETALAFLAIPLYITLSDILLKKEKIFKVYDFFFLIINTIFIVSLRAVSYFLYPKGAYTANYSISVHSIVSSLNSYIYLLKTDYNPFLEIIILIFIVRIFLYIKKNGFIKTLNNFNFEFLFLTWFLAFLSIQLPWGFAIPRYLHVALIGIYFFIAIESNYLYELLIRQLNKKSYLDQMDRKIFLNISLLVFYVLISSVIFFQVFMSIIYIQSTMSVTNANEDSLTKIANMIPRNGIVYLNTESYGNPNLELYKEIGWHFKYLFNRADIKYDYISHNIHSIKTESYVLDSPVKVLFSNKVLESRFHVSTLDKSGNEVYWIILTSPKGLISSALLSSYNIFRGRNINLNSFFGLSSRQDTWGLYRI